MHDSTRSISLPVSTRCLSTSIALLVGAVGLLTTATAAAEGIIKNPGDHPDYSVELEPHLAVMWGHGLGGTGFGPGIRANIPFLKNGPIPKINNNMAIGFGGDFAFYDHDSCGGGYYWNGRKYGAPYYGCSGNQLWFPADVQWNFFLTPVISVFGEVGFALWHWNVKFRDCGAFDCENSGTEFEPLVIWQVPFGAVVESAQAAVARMAASVAARAM